MISFHAMFGYILVSLLWGCSNPFIKHAQAVTKVQSAAEEDESEKGHKSLISSLFSWLNSFRDMRVLIPFVVNQTGSIVFFILLSKEPVSIASPVCNSLTFVVTAVTSYTLFNEVVRYPMMLIIGTVLIITGTTLCMV